MGRLFSRRKYRDLMLGLALLCAVLALMRWPQESMAAARDGLALCGNVIIPSLFPFFVLSSLVVELGMSRYLGRLLEGVMAPQFQAASFPVAFTHSITGALSSTLNICAFVLFFTVLIRMLFLSGVMGALAGGAAALLSPLGLDQAWAQRLITGLLELSSGVSSLTGAGTVTGRLSMAAFMLGWAGLSVHCQVLAFLGDSGLSLRTYLTGKLLHGGLSALFTALLVRRFPLEAPVSSYLAEQVEGIASLDFQRALTISTAAAWGVWLLFVALAVYMVKKSSGKPRPKRV